MLTKQNKIQPMINILFLGLCSLLLACTPLSYTSKVDKDLKRYDIAIPYSLEKKFNPAGASLLIYPIKTNATYNSPRIAYRLQQFDIAYYAKNEWVDTPGQLLLPVLVASMENSGLFQSVSSVSSAATTDLALDVELLKLIHEYENTSSQVQLLLRLQLIDLKRRQVLGTETINFTEPAPSNDPLGAVKATNTITNQLTRAMQNFVRNSLPAR